MNISKEWNDEERLKVFGSLSAKMSQMNETARFINEQLQDLFGELGTLGILLSLLKEADPETLESNRDQIMKFIEDPF